MYISLWSWTIINAKETKFSAFGRIPLVPEKLVTGSRTGSVWVERWGRACECNLPSERPEGATLPDLHQYVAKEQPFGLNRDRDWDASLVVFDLAPASCRNALNGVSVVTPRATAGWKYCSRGPIWSGKLRLRRICTSLYITLSTYKYVMTNENEIKFRVY